MMVIDYLNLFRVAFIPHEAKPPLIVDTDAVLSLAVAFQCFKSIATQSGQVLQRCRGVQYFQTPLGLGREACELMDPRRGILLLIATACLQRDARSLAYARDDTMGSGENLRAARVPPRLLCTRARIWVHGI